MRYQELKDILSMNNSHHWEQWVKAFHDEHPDLDINKHFLEFLFKNKHISFSDLEKIQLKEPIALSEEYEPNIDVESAKVRQNIFKRQSELGKGAMGVVHLAKDQILLRKVAYKELLLAQDFEVSPIVIRRFLNEVQITAQLDHPNIVPIYQMTPNPDGTLAYAMKLVKGDTLKALILKSQSFYDKNQHPPADLSQETLLEIFLNVCDAMEYAHSKQVIHRDLKPANIMIGPYQDVYVMDWGIAKRNSDQEPDTSPIAMSKDDTSQTEAGQIVGTPRYMSPQQAAGKNSTLDGASDQFALGLILYEILCLKPAFQNAKSQIDLLRKVLKAEIAAIEPYHSLRPIHPNLEAIIRKATQKKTPGRYASVGELAKDIRRHLKGQATLARPESQWERSLRFLRKNAKLTSLGILSMVLVSLMVISFSLFYQIRSNDLAQKRQGSLSQFQALISERSQLIEREFLKIESVLAGLANASRTALLQTNAEPGPFYTDLNYAKQATQPTDYLEAPAYQRKISLQYPGFVIPPGGQLDSFKSDIYKLHRLKNFFYQQFKAVNNQELVADHQFIEYVRQRGGHIIWAYVSLENGLHMSFPGKGPYVKGYDPRERPWYKEAKRRQGIFWGTPYKDVNGQGLVLPCLTRIHNFKQELIGISGFDTHVNSIVDKYTSTNSIPGFKNAYMLNQNKDILMKKTDQDKGFTAYHPPIQLEQTALKQKLEPGKHGYIHHEGNWWVYYYFETMNWYFVIQAEAKQVIEAYSL